LRERAANNVAIRIIYDATTEPEGDIVPTASPAHLEADKKMPGTETFVRSFMCRQYSGYHAHEGASRRAPIRL